MTMLFSQNRINSGHEELADYSTIFCGVGPAAMGVFIAATRTGRLDSLLHRGVLLVEASATLGAGSLGRYPITANSLSEAFLEGAAAAPVRSWLNGVLTTQPAARLQRLSERRFPLLAGANFLAEIGKGLTARLSRSAQSGVRLHTKVEGVSRRRDGLWTVSTRAESGGVVEFVAKNVVLGMGGQQLPSHYLQQEIEPGIRLAAYADKVAASDFILRASDLELTEYLWSRAREDASVEIAIMGGSHSAFSTAMRLSSLIKSDGKNLPLMSVTIYHRSAIRLYYPSSQAAQKDDYVFDPIKNICVDSGRVHRFGGLRYDAFDFIAPVLKKTETISWLRMRRVGPANANPEGRSLHAELSSADMIVAAFGYQPRLVPTVDERGHELVFRTDPDGALSTAGTGEVLDERGRVLAGLFAFGLGSGLRRSATAGGEASYDGRLDGVWLYQHVVGEIMVDQLLGAEDGSRRVDRRQAQATVG